MQKWKPDRLQAASEYFDDIGSPRIVCVDPDDETKVESIDEFQVKTPFTEEQEKAIDAKLAAIVAAWEAEEYKLKRQGQMVQLILSTLQLVNNLITYTTTV